MFALTRWQLVAAAAGATSAMPAVEQLVVRTCGLHMPASNVHPARTYARTFVCRMAYGRTRTCVVTVPPASVNVEQVAPTFCHLN